MYHIDYSGPDSKASYDIMRNVMKTVDFVSKGIKFTFQHVPLPYHFYAFKITQGNSIIYTAFMYVQKTSSAETALKLYDYLFDHYKQFSEEVLMDYTISQFLDELSALVSSIAVNNHSV
jgi:hypothetical protein